MRQRNNLNGAGGSATVFPKSVAGLTLAPRDLVMAKAEIKRLKQELAQARDELEELTAATSDFVRLML